eukprot:scaffold18441_cov30-Tisochrysis_lutea.AAC.3
MDLVRACMAEKLRNAAASTQLATIIWPSCTWLIFTTGGEASSFLLLLLSACKKDRGARYGDPLADAGLFEPLFNPQDLDNSVAAATPDERKRGPSVGSPRTFVRLPSPRGA